MRLYKVTQLIELARLLASSAEGLTLNEMAREMRVDRRTAERMKAALEHIFPQLDERPDGREKRFFIPGGLERLFVRVEPDELAELDSAVAGLEQSGAEARSIKLRSLARKIRASQRRQDLNRLETDVEALAAAQVPVRSVGIRQIANANHLDVLRQAILEGRQIRMRYRPASGEATARIVDPYGLLWGNAYFLVGPEKGQRRIKHWRLDRIIDISIGEVFGGSPDTFNLRDYADSIFGTFHEEPEDVVLRFDPEVADAARQFRFHATQQLLDRPDGSLEVRFRSGGLLEIARHIFTWGGTAQVIEPERLRQTLAAELDAVAVRNELPS